jgi:DNA-binding NtrC family response regulator
MKLGSLLLVDDDCLVLDAMSDWLREKGYRVAEARSANEAIACIDQTVFDVVLTDIRLEGGDGFEVLDHCQQIRPETTVILMTGYATTETEMDAIRAGAFDVLTKPLLDEHLEMTIDRALAQRRAKEEDARLVANAPVPVLQQPLRSGMQNIVGHDYRMLRVFDMINSIADTKATVLITGESGTGKSLVARAIHRHSSRCKKPFVEIACGALPETLLESELFGHVAGAFTGAAGERLGKFTLANGGTIFLDEIDTASPNMQVKLLRLLQEFEFEQVGGTKTYRVDTRVILATNEDLNRAVASGRFRRDLYYRVNVINIDLPPLRQRVADIPLLAHHFLEKICQETGKTVDGFSEETMTALRGYLWPGNVRELQNVVERAVLLGKQRQICPEDLPPCMTTPARAKASVPAGTGLKQALEGPERQIILDTLQQQNWNRNATAEQLGINRTTLYKKMKRLGLEDCDPACAGSTNTSSTAWR